MDKEAIAQFWKLRASTGVTRWTNTSLLEYELETLRKIAPKINHVLDLGCGHGELSRQLCRRDIRLHAVDMEPSFAASFSQENFFFELGEVAQFRSATTYDLILLFGVITYLTSDEECRAYANIAGLKQKEGVVVVKNQCSVDEEFIFDDQSKDLGSRYIGRYPNLAAQLARLKECFSTVEVLKYPSCFRFHETSEHVMFVCR